MSLLSDKVILVVRDDEKADSYSDKRRSNGVTDDTPKAVVVFNDNKQQLKSARKWGEIDVFGGISYQVTHIEPIEYLIDNKDIEVTILNPTDIGNAKGCSWTCLIEQPEIGISVSIGLPLTSINSLIKESTIINGKIQEKCSFYRSNTGIMLVHPRMSTYKDIMKDYDKPRVKSTKVWRIGQSYMTKTMHHLYVGKIYDWFDIESDFRKCTDKSNYNGYYCNANEQHYIFKLRENPVELHELLDLSSMNKEYYSCEGSNFTKLSEVFKYTLDKISNTFSYDYMYSLLRETPYLYFRDSLVKSFPTRGVGEITMEVDSEACDKLQAKILTKLRERILECSMSRDRNSITSDTLRIFLLSTSKDEPPKLSDKEISILKTSLHRVVHLDLGNGIVIDGVR